MLKNSLQLSCVGVGAGHILSTPTPNMAKNLFIDSDSESCQLRPTPTNSDSTVLPLCTVLLLTAPLHVALESSYNTLS